VIKVLPAGDTEVKADLCGPVDTQLDSRWCMGAERASNNTSELNGMGQGLLWVRDKYDTDDAAVFLYDSMYAANMVQGLWKPKSSVPMIRHIRTILDDIKTGRSATRRPRSVYVVHVKSHQDDANRHQRTWQYPGGYIRPVGKMTWSVFAIVRR
jgi:ribonuclease HI